MTDLKRDIRFLLAQYGSEQVYSTLHVVLQEEYLALQNILQNSQLGSQVAAVSPVAQPAAPAAEVGSISAEVSVKQPTKPTTKYKNPPITQAPKNSKNPTITVKKEGQEKRGRKKQLPPSSPIISPLEKDEVVHPVADVPVESETKFRDAKEMRAWQKAQEVKKRAELDAQGITVASLLTKENLEKWVSQEGRTYSYIAREYVGCADAQVSAAAKTYGIQSSNSAKRVALFSHGKN